MMPKSDDNGSDSELILDAGQSPFHGYAPAIDPLEFDRFTPPFSVVISRETGSRGGSVARRTAELLGWSFIDQESLEYVTRNEGVSFPKEELPSNAERWVELQLQELRDNELLDTVPEVEVLSRLILEVAARGSSVILSRGAGLILPSETRLLVQLFAPEKDRVTYLAQLERLSYPDALQVVRERDNARKKLLVESFGRAPDEILQYDMILNSSQFGIEGCAAIIARAATERLALVQSHQPNNG